MTPSPLPNCPHCGSPLPPDALQCPACKRFVYEARLTELLREAQRQEPIDPILAASTWRQCLSLLPPESPEAQQIAARAAALGAGMFQARQGVGMLDYGRTEPKSDTWLTVLLKTGGSMALCMAVYSKQFGWPFAIGFVLLILIHELGHTVANWCYDIKQSPPIFLPFVGALIMLKQNPPDAKAEAVIGIAGPIAGTLGAILCYILFLYTGYPVLYQLAMFSFGMNLFNLIPIWPLDGGRVAAGITPILWILGVAVFAWVMLHTGGNKSIGSILIAIWVLQGTLPRIRDVVFRGGMRDAYYRIGAPARIAILFSYTMLSALLVLLGMPIIISWFPVLRHFVK